MESSIRKLKANARNARLSTGPKDTSRSRFNAAKHGILSSRVVVRTGDGKEDEEEFEEFSRQMWEDLAPAGVLEGSLVEDLINIIWRKRRILVHESALISQKAATAQRDWEQRNQVSVGLEGLLSSFRRPEPEIPDFEELGIDFDSPGETAHQLLQGIDSILSNGVAAPSVSEVSPFVVAVLLVLRAKKAVEESMGSESDLSDPALQDAVIELVQEWGISVRSIIGPSLDRSFPAEDMEMLIAVACLREEITREEFWDELDQLVEDKLEKACSALNELALEAQREIELASLPDEAELAKIQRYEAHLSRQQGRALHELQRLQVARLSGRPSAPAAIDVTLDS